MKSLRQLKSVITDGFSIVMRIVREIVNDEINEVDQRARQMLATVVDDAEDMIAINFDFGTIDL
jgi:hypothetical protein